MRYVPFILVTVILLTGCTRLRIVMDLVPGEDALTETVVIRDDGRTWRRPKIAMIDVNGVIVDGRRGGFLASGDNPVADYVEALQKAECDSRVKAILVRVNSPGGTVTASDVLFRETVRFREKSGKPVIVLMSDVAASGGYYLACAGDTVVAHPTTITGSIGVIIQTINFSEGMRRIGIRADAITSGPNKAAGSPLEPMSPEHRALFQGLVDEFYESFVRVVVENRSGLKHEQIDEITDGRVVTGSRALELGLVDHLGDLRDAFRIAKELAESPNAVLVKYHRPLEHVASPYAAAPAPQGASQINLLQLNLAGAQLHDAPMFYYLWDPAAFGGY
jgi:protease IV